MCTVQQALSSIAGTSPLPWSVHVHSCCPALAGGRGGEGCPTGSRESTSLKLPLATRTHTATQRLPGGGFTALSQTQINTIPFVPSPSGAAKALGAVWAFHRVRLWQWRTAELISDTCDCIHSPARWIFFRQREKLSARLKCIHKQGIISSWLNRTHVQYKTQATGIF